MGDLLMDCWPLWTFVFAVVLVIVGSKRYE